MYTRECGVERLPLDIENPLVIEIREDRQLDADQCDHELDEFLRRETGDTACERAASKRHSDVPEHGFDSQHGLSVPFLSVLVFILSAIYQM